MTGQVTSNPAENREYGISLPSSRSSSSASSLNDQNHSSSLTEMGQSNVEPIKKATPAVEVTLDNKLTNISSGTLGAAKSKLISKIDHIAEAHNKIRNALADFKEYILLTEFAVPNLATLIFDLSGLNSKKLGESLAQAASGYSELHFNHSKSRRLQIQQT